MTAPLMQLLNLVPDAHSTHTHVATVLEVDTVKQTLRLDDGALDIQDVPYLGHRPIVGRQVLVLVFDNRAVAIGGDDAPNSLLYQARQTFQYESRPSIVFTDIPRVLRQLTLSWKCETTWSGPTNERLLMQIGGSASDYLWTEHRIDNGVVTVNRSPQTPGADTSAVIGLAGTVSGGGSTGRIEFGCGDNGGAGSPASARSKWFGTSWIATHYAEQHLVDVGGSGPTGGFVSLELFPENHASGSTFHHGDFQLDGIY